jgi:hypothetical protein
VKVCYNPTFTVRQATKHEKPENYAEKEKTNPMIDVMLQLCYTLIKGCEEDDTQG